MKRPLYCVVMLMMILLGASMLPAKAQVPVPAESVDSWRYQFMAHNFSVEGAELEVYLKLDSFTGRTWRFQVGNPQWSMIPEQTSGWDGSSSNLPRYELFAHNYEDQNGQPQEVILRTDALTGYTWMYRGAEGGWREIGQDD